MPTLAAAIRNTSLLLQVTGYAPCPVCKIGRLHRPTGSRIATCPTCGSKLS